jgi:hypothetical protein
MESKLNPIATQLWKDGPKRMFSTEPFLGGRPYAAAGLKGYVGQMYICDRCRREVLRVLSCFGCSDWVCERCAKDTPRPLAVVIEP